MSLNVIAVVLTFGYLTFTQGADVSPKVLYSEGYSPPSHHYLQSSYQKQKHPCNRECIVGQSLSCYWKFVVHYYEMAGKRCNLTYDNPALGCIRGDGVATPIMVVNHELPGVSMEICQGDTIIVDVLNLLRDPTTIHWHGLLMKKSPYMDGAPMTTQYPIQPAEAFRYTFPVPDMGTHWWHSHMHYQRSYGVGGALVVRRPTKIDPHAHLYDYDKSDHILYIQDWFFNYTITTPTNVLINGKGYNPLSKTAKPSDYPRFNVVQGHRYRFRVIYNGNANCPIKLFIDHHDMLLLSTDGNDIEPVVVKSVVLTSAERLDFVLYAAAPVDNYWLRVKAYGFCERAAILQGGVIEYKGAPQYELPKRTLQYEYEPKGLQLNPIDKGPSSDPSELTMVDINGLDYTKWETNQVFKTFYTSLSIYINNGFFGLQMDHIYFDNPKVSLLQSRFLDIESSFCNKSSLLKQGMDCTKDLCRCMNIIQIPAYDYIEFVVSSETATGHPIHTHGINYKVVGMGVLGPDLIKTIEDIDKVKPLPRRLDRSPVTKDTTQVPGFGYVIFRFYSDNPGFWMYHCHLEIHSEAGMTSILKIGENTQMAHPPKEIRYGYFE